MRLYSPFARHVFLDGGIDAAQHAGDSKLRVACDIEGRQFRQGCFPHLGANFFQPQDDVEQAAPFEGKRARARPDRSQIKETAFLLVAFCKRCRSLVFFERSGEIRLALKVILFGIVVANEGNPQSRNRRGGIETGWIRCVVERQFRRIPPFDVISEIRPLLLG